MTKYYRDYFWKDGLPYGLDPGSYETSYKIIMDPYRKRISIEKYVLEQFSNCIYDSALLNFRHLNQIEQQSWQKTKIQETEDTIQCLIRDQDDRVLFIETYFFQQGYCKNCVTKSPQGILLSRQETYYKILGDKENKVILFDSNQHPVLQKIYNADPETGEFTTLVTEVKNMQWQK